MPCFSGTYHNETDFVVKYDTDCYKFDAQGVPLGAEKAFNGVYCRRSTIDCPARLMQVRRFRCFIGFQLGDRCQYLAIEVNQLFQ